MQSGYRWNQSDQITAAYTGQVVIHDWETHYHETMPIWKCSTTGLSGHSATCVSVNVENKKMAREEIVRLATCWCCDVARRHIRSRSINPIWQPTPSLSISIKTRPSADKYRRKWGSAHAPSHLSPPSSAKNERTNGSSTFDTPADAR